MIQALDKMLGFFCLKSVLLNIITFLLFLKLLAQTTPDYQEQKRILSRGRHFPLCECCSTYTAASIVQLSQNPMMIIYSGKNLRAIP